MKVYKIIGLMSGTSLDGLDLAYCHIWMEKGTWHFDIKKTKSVCYGQEMMVELKDAVSLSAEKLIELHNRYGRWLGEQALNFIQNEPLEVDYIASHGHTTHHRPELGFTFQVGSGQHLANTTGIKVICDFRTNDVALGGQGAPLVPIGDRIFFGEYDFCLNLGGISNISFEKNGKTIAYDIGLANMILNHITRKVGLDYDEDGKLARNGTINQQMLHRLNNLDFYKLAPPKSIGYEWFLAEVVPIIEETEDCLENLLHTSIHHICQKIAEQVALHSFKKEQQLLVTGGGALNSFFMETLQEKLGENTKVVIPNDIIIAFKEALIFALMGVLRLENEINVLSAATGARRDSSSGVIFLPN